MSFSRTDLDALAAAADGVRRRFLARLREDGEDAELDGGPGSGNWGHRGRPGQHGGSMPGGGVHNRREAPGTSGKYTSWSKQRAAAAKEHEFTEAELASLPAGSVVIAGDGFRYRKAREGGFEKGIKYYRNSYLAGKRGRIAIADSSNPNLQKGVDNVDFGGYRERMEKAPRYESRQAVDDIMRGPAGTVWKSLTPMQKQALHDYTAGFNSEINTCLRTGTLQEYRSTCETIRKVLDGAKTPQDMWVQRGVDTEGAAKMLGLSMDDMRAVMRGDVPPSSLTGQTGLDRGFMSAGSTAGTGFTENDVTIHIFMPEGTKALYCEPFSTYGGGQGASWDGEKKQKRFGDEFETLIQAGTSVQVSRAWMEGDQLHMEAFVTGQQ